ncbi:MAG: DUF4070 domain-containing protein [Candidatus Aureabacteria bacterium]|nr:DUF4070 domain-containing protein [Candidatus Auribacterota bacterium]
MSVSVCLINPLNRNSFWSCEYNRGIRNNESAFYPLNLATVGNIFHRCGMIEVCIIDENIEDKIQEAEQSDIIGITGFLNQKDRIFQIAEYFRNKGKYVIIGGPLASVLPEEVQPRCSTVFVGNCGDTIPLFVEDYYNHNPKNIYSYDPKTAKTDFVVPRLDLLKMDRYGGAMIQTTIGCSSQCEFCATHLHSGREIKTKPYSMIIEELRNILRYKGPTSVFLADDNAYANKSYFKNLMGIITSFQKENGYPFRFSTQITVLIAQDENLLESMANAGFYSVLIGLETPDIDSAREAKKDFNFSSDIHDAVKTIQTYGISVDSGSILGFDHDTKDSHKNHFEFFQSLNIPLVGPTMLYAFPKTKLYNRLMNEGRLIEERALIASGAVQGTSDTAMETNFIPKSMTMEELINGTKMLQEKLYSFKYFGERLVNYLKIPVKINNELFIHAHAKRKNKFKIILKTTAFFLIEEFPRSFIIYLKVLYYAWKNKRFFIAFWHMVLYKQTYTFYMRLSKNRNFSTKYDRIAKYFSRRSKISI